MMNGDWNRWIPLSESKIKGNYYVRSLKDSFEGLEIIMDSDDIEGLRLKITFEDYVWSYKNTNESYCWNIFAELSDKYGDDFYVKWAFFKVDNSDYLKWVSEKSSGFYDYKKAQHFVIMGLEQVINVINDKDPKFEIIENR